MCAQIGRLLQTENMLQLRTDAWPVIAPPIPNGSAAWLSDNRSPCSALGDTRALARYSAWCWPRHLFQSPESTGWTVQVNVEDLPQLRDLGTLRPLPLQPPANAPKSIAQLDAEERSEVYTVINIRRIAEKIHQAEAEYQSSRKARVAKAHG